MSRLKTNQCLYIDEIGAWRSDETIPKHGDIVKNRVSKTFTNVCWYYANIIDYTRIFMTLVALSLILFYNNTNAPFLVECCISLLIFGSVLLNAVDEKVARHFNQSTVMGI
jgi:phosphatidylglycerophosphate synthase